MNRYDDVRVVFKLYEMLNYDLNQNLIRRFIHRLERHIRSKISKNEHKTLMKLGHCFWVRTMTHVKEQRNDENLLLLFERTVLRPIRGPN